MNIFADFHERISKAILALGLIPVDGSQLSLARVTVEPPRDAAHGDLATNAAMVLSKAVGENPRVLAQKIADRLKDEPDVARVDIAGPGFINLALSDAFWQARLREILAAGPDYGRSTVGAGRRGNDALVRLSRHG